MYHNTVQDAAGNIINGAVITVKLASDNSIATIYDKDGSALSNPFVSGYDRSKGETDFKAANELYNVEVVNGTTTTIESISLIDPNTFSTGMTSADRIKLDSIESSADVTDAANVTAAGASIANMTLVATDVVEETNLQSWATGVGSALLRARGTGVSSTYVSSVTVNGTVFAQPAVSGEINGDQGYFTINYAGATGISVSNLTSSNTFVYINNAGNLAQQTSEPTRQDWVRKIFVMRIAVDTVAQTILGFEYLNNPIGHYANSMRDLYSFMLAQGLPFKKDQIITGRSSDLGFDVSAGSLLEFGGTGDIYNPNIKNFSAVTNATFFLSTRTAFDSGTNTDLPKLWDNNSTLTILGSTTLVAHRLYRFSNGNICLQYGQANYANMTLAKAGAPLEQYVLNPGLKNATFFGWWFIELSASNTGGTTLTDFVEYTLGIQGGSSGGLSGAVVRANNGSDFLDFPVLRTNIGIGTTDSPQFAGVYLGGSTSANLLDDYEEGTWTPTSVTGTLSSADAYYYKIGSMVYIWCYLDTFSDTTSSIEVEIGGLPFSINSSTDAGVGTIMMSHVDVGSNAFSANVFVRSASSTLRIYSCNDNSNYSVVNHSSISSSSNIRLQVAYRAA